MRNAVIIGLRPDGSTEAVSAIGDRHELKTEFISLAEKGSSDFTELQLCELQRVKRHRFKDQPADESQGESPEVGEGGEPLEVERKSLAKLKVSELRDLAASENVPLDDKAAKAEVIEAIMAKRHPTETGDGLTPPAPE